VSAPEPTEEQLQAELEEQMRRIRVEDVLLQTVVTLVNLAGRRLGLAPGVTEAERDLGQSRLAIEAVRALMPLIEGPDAGPIRNALAQLQMAYARETQAEGGEAPAAAGPVPGAAQGPSERAPDPGAGDRDTAREEAERAKARARIWTPPGA